METILHRKNTTNVSRLEEKPSKARCVHRLPASHVRVGPLKRVCVLVYTIRQGPCLSVYYWVGSNKRYSLLQDRQVEDWCFSDSPRGRGILFSKPQGGSWESGVMDITKIYKWLNQNCLLFCQREERSWNGFLPSLKKKISRVNCPLKKEEKEGNSFPFQSRIEAGRQEKIQSAALPSWSLLFLSDFFLSSTAIS